MTAPAGPPKMDAMPKASTQRQSTQSLSDYKFKVSSGIEKKALKIVIYGTSGIGKTTLATIIKNHVQDPLVLDIDKGSLDQDCERISNIESWDALRYAVNDKTLWKNRDALIIDSVTAAEEMAIAWVINNVPHEEGKQIRTIDCYGWGKGYRHIYDQFLLLLADLDRHIMANRHVILVSHVCTTSVPNPEGNDWIRYEPRIMSPQSGKSSIRNRIVEWSGHLLFIGYDVAVSNKNRATGAGTRMIYPCELPTHLAKSHTLSEPIPFVSATDSTLWKTLLKKD